ncbi:MAG TPA: DEAD/DEAH box helicase [Anaerolineae bacterium]|nr:DEAD/DEAH box helicase [Anaerolineae bacterium]
MRPERHSRTLLAITRSKAKMYEYSVPAEHHIAIPKDPARLFRLTIGLLGDLAAQANSDQANHAQLSELQTNLRFASYFLDAYRQSRLDQALDPNLLLLGSASYYLCNLPGSSGVLANQLAASTPDLGCTGLEGLMVWLLRGDFAASLSDPGAMYGEHISAISLGLAQYYQNGSGETGLDERVRALRVTAYRNGTPRQLLFADVISALVKKRCENSTWHCLPQYSDLPASAWLSVLRKPSFIRELWPAQRLLGEQGVFRGESAVVQMPTSAGKTRATQIIIRSAFLSGRARLAVIVAPFRALCHEIRESLRKTFHGESVRVDELSDALQMDFRIGGVEGRHQVLVVTPEKLAYILRQTPQLAENIGLVIYDEGHQFDNGTRGVTYELLLTSLKAMLPATTQTVLLSAVVSNAEDISSWLGGPGQHAVSGTGLNPTLRTLGFASWTDAMGRLEFVSEDDPDTRQFFVPRVIESFELELKPRESKKRIFPDREDGPSVALYLGLRLAKSGAVAIFCGMKTTAARLCRMLVDAYERGLTLQRPGTTSDYDEVRRLHYLHECHFGDAADATQCARHGVFSHHGNTPQGIRLAVEHAMKTGLARFVICTSTLAQGVNIPIRYLIVTGIYQGQERIKVRDFHNLLGRAGRSGMHTEGSVLFADPKVYDGRSTNATGCRRWSQVKQMLDPRNSEPCASTLLSVVSPWEDDWRTPVAQLDLAAFLDAYLGGTAETSSLVAGIAAGLSHLGLESRVLERQIADKLSTVSAVESYLMAHWDDSGPGIEGDRAAELARGTLAYHLADEDQRTQLLELFRRLAAGIAHTIPDSVRRQAFGRTLYGTRDCINIDGWVGRNLEGIVACSTQEDLLSAVWPVLEKHVGNTTFRKSTPAEPLRAIATAWIQGRPFSELYGMLAEEGVRIGEGRGSRDLRIEHVVDICQNGLSYDGMLVLGAITEVIGLIAGEHSGRVIGELQGLQKRLRYGLPSGAAICLHELGFADRVVAMELSDVPVLSVAGERGAMREALRSQEQTVRAILGRYPAYFTAVFVDIFA